MTGKVYTGGSTRSRILRSSENNTNRDPKTTLRKLSSEEDINYGNDIFSFIGIKERKYNEKFENVNNNSIKSVNDKNKTNKPTIKYSSKSVSKSTSKMISKPLSKSDSTRTESTKAEYKYVIPVCELQFAKILKANNSTISANNAIKEELVLPGLIHVNGLNVCFNANNQVSGYSINAFGSIRVAIISDDCKNSSLNTINKRSYGPYKNSTSEINLLKNEGDFGNLCETISSKSSTYNISQSEDIEDGVIFDAQKCYSSLMTLEENLVSLLNSIGRLTTGKSRRHLVADIKKKAEEFDSFARCIINFFSPVYNTQIATAFRSQLRESINDILNFLDTPEEKSQNTQKGSLAVR